MSEKYTNPHYLAYAKYNGKSPDEMMEHDTIEYPGGCMCGFILWMSAMKQKFWEVSRDSFLDRHVIGDLDAWEKFLQDSVVCD